MIKLQIKKDPKSSTLHAKVEGNNSNITESIYAIKSIIGFIRKNTNDITNEQLKDLLIKCVEEEK